MSAHDEEVLGKAYDSRLMKRLLVYARPYRLHIAGSILLTVFISAIGPVRPYITKVAIDDYIAKGNASGLWHMAILLFLTLLAQAVAHAWMTVTVRRALAAAPAPAVPDVALARVAP